MDPAASRTKNQKYYVVDVETDTGLLVSGFNKMEKAERDRILGYAEALLSMSDASGKGRKKRG